MKIFNKLKNKNSKLILYKGKREKIEEELKAANIVKYNIEIKKLESSDKERHIVIINNI